MFDNLSGKLQNAFRNLRGLGKISEDNISDSLRDVRMALLDADVNFKVVKEFIDRVKVKSLGQEVIASLHPGSRSSKSSMTNSLPCSAARTPLSSLRTAPLF